jgi:hypothetical protein
VSKLVAGEEVKEKCKFSCVFVHFPISRLVGMWPLCLTGPDFYLPIIRFLGAWPPEIFDLPVACPGGEFVVSRAGEAL